VPLVKRGALAGGSSGALWGTLIGLLFLNPLAGMAIGAGVGAASGALAGKLSDYGIPDDFIRELGPQDQAELVGAVPAGAEGRAENGGISGLFRADHRTERLSALGFLAEGSTLAANIAFCYAAVRSAPLTS
jgi:hypothetical protein